MSTTPPPPRVTPFENVERIGTRSAPLTDLFHQIMAARWRALLGAILVAYLALNTLFAGLYLLGGDCVENAEPGSFRDMFFFSVQTMATIGYGKMVPRTTWANAVVSVEALCGIVGTAMATGLMFAKFSRTSARVLFSRVAVVARRDGVESFMFRMANERGNQIAEATVRVVASRNEVTPEGERVRRFYDLSLTRDRNAAFTLSWTVIHPISRASPIHDATRESFLASGTLIIISVVGTDDTSGQTVHARHVYTPDDLRWNERFVDILSDLPDGRRQIDYTRFHDTQPMAETTPPTG
jgi:inward rectifier potassium channel